MEKLKAVIIDDSKTILYLIKNYLAEIEIESEIFENPLDGIEYLKNNKADFIFVDYLMPQINGIELIERIKPFFNGIIIMITSTGKDDLKLLALEKGATGFINKPIVKAEFLATVKNLAKLQMMNKMLENEKLLIEAEVERQLKYIKQQEKEILEILAQVAEYRDENTFLHVKRVAGYSKIIAQYMGFDKKIQEIIYQAAPLHDIGKIGIRDNILLKKEKLTKEEFEIMKTHTIIGYEILKNSTSEILQMGAEIALTHHERWDGKGYPYGKKGEEISLYGRIVAIADVFDALTTKRPYKENWSLDKALNFIVKNSGTMFDPKIVDTFLKAHKKIFDFYNKSNVEK